MNFWKQFAGMGLAKAAWWFLSSSFFQTVVYPVILSAGTVVAAQFSGVPIAYMIPLAAGTFASVALGLTHISLLRERLAIDGRLSLLEVITIPEHGIENGVITVRTVQYNLFVQSHAHQPINYSIKPISVTFDGRVAKNAVYSNLGGTVMPGVPSSFRFAPIALSPPLTYQLDAAPHQVTGTIEYELHYGRAGALSNKISQKIQVTLNINQNGIAGAPWVFTE
jgi:hypothetical protein